MAAEKMDAPCPDETFIPLGTTDFTCYVHPQAGVGIAIATFSILLGILVVFTGIVASSTLRDRSTARTSRV
jgi:hypothetical protein